MLSSRDALHASDTAAAPPPAAAPAAIAAAEEREEAGGRRSSTLGNQQPRSRGFQQGGGEDQLAGVAMGGKVDKAAEACGNLPPGPVAKREACGF